MALLGACRNIFLAGSKDDFEAREKHAGMLQILANSWIASLEREHHRTST